MKLSKILNISALTFAAATLVAPVAHAANWSSTKLEYLQGSNYERNDESQSILTLANASGFSWGDSFIFADFGDWRDTKETDGIHSELSFRYSLLRGFGEGAWKKRVIKDIYLMTQFDITANQFANKTVQMFGVSVDWAVPGFRFFKTHLQTRDDPTADDTSMQLTLVWNMGFGTKKSPFSFEGFLDYTTEEGNGKTNILTQPSVVYHVNKSIAVGLEYQYWQNRLGIDGLDESAAQLLARWTL